MKNFRTKAATRPYPEDSVLLFCEHRYYIWSDNPHKQKNHVADEIKTIQLLGRKSKIEEARRRQ